MLQKSAVFCKQGISPLRVHRGSQSNGGLS